MSNFALILLTGGMVGGAEKRFIQLFDYISGKYPNNFFFLITFDLYDIILKIYPDYPTQNLIPIGEKTVEKKDDAADSNKSKSYTISHPGFIKQVYRFFNNYRIQKNHFKEIDKIRKERDIKCFLGIYNGILPLYFYLMKKKRDVGVIFCDMDSWFSDVLPKERKYWYRRYNSFNYALENSDIIDFLSPFILEGVKERGIKIKEESVSITPCSFTDYSKCKIGDKSIFQIAFAGRLEKDKNPEIFLNAAIVLSKKYPEMIFHIMGEGRLSASIRSQITNSRLNNIIFHGFHSRPTDILADSSVFVSLQSTNNYPSQSVLEAMGCGNAIIVTDVGDTRMFINENNGILIDLDVNQLVKEVESLFLNKELRERLGNYAYKYVRDNHTVEKMADYYISLFDRCTNNY
ncbi:MAG TPA: hypothetical protein DHV28_00955 [Ignavibacteriales bacterium]|nr:hypothetical protein [Ignavibacteriales bacterium]